MSTFIQEYDSVFFLSFFTLLFGFFGVVVKYCLKSKCQNINLCFGLLSIERRVDLEVQTEMKEIEMIHNKPNEEEIEREVSPV